MGLAVRPHFQGQGAKPLILCSGQIKAHETVFPTLSTTCRSVERLWHKGTSKTPLPSASNSILMKPEIASGVNSGVESMAPRPVYGPFYELWLLQFLHSPLLSQTDRQTDRNITIDGERPLKYVDIHKNGPFQGHRKQHKNTVLNSKIDIRIKHKLRRMY